MRQIKKRLFEILEAEPADDDSVNRVVGLFFIVLILLNVLTVVLETVETVYTAHKIFFGGFEVFSVVVFSVEYVLRLWTCTLDPRFNPPILGRLRYALTPMAVIDLLAILPFYLPMLIPLDLRMIRMLRLFRLLRLFKMERYSGASRVLVEVFKEKKEELLLVAGFVVMMLVFSSSLMYFIENAAQPQIFSSIPATMWWSVATLTTVGYGDMLPVTPLGRLLGALIALLGIGLFALPAGILASGFAEKVQTKQRETICPHCGKKINEER